MFFTTALIALVASSALTSALPNNGGPTIITVSRSVSIDNPPTPTPTTSCSDKVETKTSVYTSDSSCVGTVTSCVPYTSTKDVTYTTTIATPVTYTTSSTTTKYYTYTSVATSCETVPVTSTKTDYKTSTGTSWVYESTCSNTAYPTTTISKVPVTKTSYETKAVCTTMAGNCYGGGC